MRALVCFAVKEEAKFFQPPENCVVLFTGMGQPAARAAGQAGLDRHRPDLVLTCGFAGGLNPGLSVGDVVFDTAEDGLARRLRESGAVAARFHCAPRVAVTRADKARLRIETGADVVEMESGVLRELCQERGIPAATIRVISDAADEDLPIDFNELITPDGRLRLGGLVGQVLLHPGRVPGLLSLQKKTARAARALAGCLETLLKKCD